MSLPKLDIPEALQKPIEEIKNPILRGWIITLVILVFGAIGVIAYMSQNKDRNYREENTALRVQLNNCLDDNKRKDAEEIKRLQARDRFFDSVLTSLNSIKKSNK